MSTETTEPGTTAPPPPPPHENRFFGWLRSTGVRRQPGWIGGVCAGIAERIGIDPLIVRGIVVVLAVLGAPAILLYAVAWLLLPDRFTTIHLEELFRGRVSGALAAIAGLIVLSMLPVTQGFWSAGAAFWDGSVSIGRITWTIVLLGALVAVIVWLSRRATPFESTAPGGAAPGGTAPGSTASDTTAPDSTADAASAASADPTDGGGSRSLHHGAANTAHHGSSRTAAAAATPSSRPARPGADATHEDFAAWRDQQAAWKAERAAFQAEELATIRESNLARSKERREAALARAAEDAERRRAWDRANPTLPGAVVAITVGLAIIVGGIASLVASSLDNWDGSELAAGLGTATVIVGVVIVGAGAFGRRNGFLIFLSVVLLIATLAAALVPSGRQLVGTHFSTAGTGSFTQLAGQLSVLADQDGGGTGGTVDLWQGSGTTQIEVAEGRTIRVEVTSLDQRLTLERAVSPDYVPAPDEDFTSSDSGVPQAIYEYPQLTADGNEYSYTATIGPGLVPDETVRLWQGNGDTLIIDHNVKAADQ